MPRFNVPEDVPAEEFFSKYVPEQFGDLAAGADLFRSLFQGRSGEML